MSARPLDRVRTDLLGAVEVARVHARSAEGATASPAVLAETLYRRWFCGLSDRESGSGAADTGGAYGYPSLTARLRAAHWATDRFDHGWTVQSTGRGGAVRATKGSEQLDLLPPDYVNVARPAVPVRAGDAIAVTARRDGLDADNGWWMSYGPAHQELSEHLLRLYWNCPVEAVATLVGGVTAALGPRGVVYSMKCPAVGAGFDRIDAVVVYLGRDDWPSISKALREMHERGNHRLRSPVPPLTLRLAAGVALAEDPGDGQSFGQSRCAAVAEGIRSAGGISPNAAPDPLEDEALVEAILAGFAARGISPTHPHLQVGTPPEELTGW